MTKQTTKAGVKKLAFRAINALKDLHEDSHNVQETRDAARGYLDGSIHEVIEDISKFIRSLD